MKFLLTIFLFAPLTCIAQRDQEITGFTPYGSLIARSNGESGIALFHFFGRNEIKIVQVFDGLNRGAVPENWGTQKMLFITQDLDKLVPTYKQGADTFKLSVVGFDIVVSLNGVVLYSGKQIDFMQAGKAELKTNGGWDGWISTTTLPTKKLYSKGNVLDLRDLGLKEARNYGKMTAGSPVLTLSYKNTKLKEGDIIDVENAGGTFPELNDTLPGQPVNTFAYVLNGNVYRTNGVKWNYVGTPTMNGGGYVANQYYYWSKVSYIGLRAKILKIEGKDGKILTLDKPAKRTIKYTTVYFDNYDVYNFLRDANKDGKVINNPSGKYAIGQTVYIENWNNGTFQGKGKIFSPNSFPSACLMFQNIHNSTFKDFTLEGNARAKGYGANWFSGNPDKPIASQTAFPTFDHNRGLVFTLCSNLKIENVKSIDVFSGLLIQQSENIKANVHVTLSDGIFSYLYWQVQAADSKNIEFINCTVTSPVLTWAIEGVKSNNIVFSGGTVTNGVAAFNNANGEINNMRFTVKPLSQQNNPAFSPGTSIINVNRNIGSNFSSLVIIDSTNVSIEGYINKAGDGIDGITTEQRNVIVNAGSYKAPMRKTRWGSAARGPISITGFKTLNEIREN